MEDSVANNQEDFLTQLQYLHWVVQENSQQNLYGNDIVHENVNAHRYQFTCMECHSQFNEKRFYKQHILVHQQMYECAFCNACFGNKSYLQSHILLHMSTYKCVYCESAFASKEHLVDHISCHNTIFFECEECEAKFVKDEDLQVHVKCHLSSGTMVHVFRCGEEGLQQEQEMIQMNKEQPPPQEQVLNWEEEQQQSLEPVVLPMNTEQKMQQQKTTHQSERVSKVLLGVSLPKLRLTDGRPYYVCILCYCYSLEKWKIRRHSKIHKRRSKKFLHVCSVCGTRFHMTYAHQVNP